MKLSGTELFRGVSPESFEKMKKCLRLHIIGYQKGETVCHYGSVSDRIGIVLTGRAEIVRTDYNGNESLLEDLPEGSIFSELMSYARTAGDSIMVRCSAKASIAYLDYDTVRGHCPPDCKSPCPDAEIIRSNLMELLIRRSMRLSERVEVLGCRSIREKLLCYFRLQLKGKETGRFRLHFTFMELASYINADRSAMMRELSNMKKDGTISVSEHTVRVLKKFND